jgi:hypothetical protein
MFLILFYLAEAKSGESREIADELGVFNAKYMSVLLGRCWRRGLVTRTPYQRGKERGYTYFLSEKGAKWILHRVSKKKQPSVPEPVSKVVVKEVPVVVYRDAQPKRKSLIEEASDLTRLKISMDTLNQLSTQKDTSPQLLMFSHAMSESENRTSFPEVLLAEEKRKSAVYERCLKTVSEQNNELVRMILDYIKSSKETKEAVRAIEESTERFERTLQRHAGIQHDQSLFDLGRSFGRLDMATEEVIRKQKELISRLPPMQIPHGPTAKEMKKIGEDWAILSRMMVEEARESVWPYASPTEYLYESWPSLMQKRLHKTSPIHVQVNSEKKGASVQTEPKEQEEDWESINLGWHRWLPKAA